MRVLLLLTLALTSTGCGGPPKATDTGTSPSTSTGDSTGTPTDTDSDSGPDSTPDSDSTDSVPPHDSVLTELEIDDDRDGYTELEGDCDDTLSRMSPDRFEDCNAYDDDCDGVVDEDCPDHPVRSFIAGRMDVQDGVLVYGETSYLYLDRDGDLLCKYAMVMTDVGYAPAAPCPDCEWSFAVTRARQGWFGDYCDRIEPLNTVEIEATAERWETNAVITYWGYAPLYVWDHPTDNLYYLEETVFAGGPAGPTMSQAAFNYQPWASYEVTVVGSAVYWQIYYGGSHYYTYTP